MLANVRRDAPAHPEAHFASAEGAAAGDIRMDATALLATERERAASASPRRPHTQQVSPRVSPRVSPSRFSPPATEKKWENDSASPSVGEHFWSPEAVKRESVGSLVLDNSWQSVMTLTNQIIEFSQAPALDVETEVISSVSDFASRSTCGIMLNHSLIDNIVPGGPAFNSRQLSRGDQILQVDGFDCAEASTDTMHNLLVGSDIPGSTVTVTVKKYSQGVHGTVQDVTLVRMANEEIVDRRKLFELFTRLKDHAKQHHAHGIAKMIDDTILLWTRMVIADVLHDETIEKNVRNLQAGLKERLEGLSYHLSQLQVHQQIVSMDHLSEVQRMEQQLAQKRVREECVQIQLGMDMDRFKYQACCREVAQDVALAIGGNVDKIRPIGLDGHSGVVNLDLDTDVCGEGKMVLDIIRHLAHQVEDPNSKLRRGVWTSKVTFVKIGHVPESVLLAEIDRLQSSQSAKRLEDANLRCSKQLEEMATKYAALQTRMQDEINIASHAIAQLKEEHARKAEQHASALAAAEERLAIARTERMAATDAAAAAHSAAVQEQAEHQRARAKKVVQRLMNRALVQGFERWRDSVVEERQMKAKALKVVQRLMNRALVQGFERWRDSVVEERQMKAKVVQRLMNRALVQGFERWRDSVVEERQMKAKALRVVQRLMKSCIAYAFGRWTEHAVLEKEFDLQRLRVVRRRRRLDLYIPFVAWLQCIEKLKNAKIVQKTMQQFSRPRIRRSMSWSGSSIITSPWTDSDDRLWRSLAQLYWAKVTSFVDTATRYFQLHDRTKQVREDSLGGHLFDATYTGFMHDSVASTSELVHAIGQFADTNAARSRSNLCPVQVSTMQMSCFKSIFSRLDL
jgi:hypothetical protein